MASIIHIFAFKDEGTLMWASSVTFSEFERKVKVSILNSVGSRYIYLDVYAPFLMFLISIKITYFNIIVTIVVFANNMQNHSKLRNVDELVGEVYGRSPKRCFY